MSHSDMDNTVLIVDDDSSIRWVLARALSNAQFKVLSCDNGQQAISMIESARPQLVITDIQMSGMDGLELLASINQQWPDLPVIMITAYADTDLATKTHELGAFDYLPKPFDINHVIKLCQRAVDSKRERQELPLWLQQIEKKIDSEYHQGNSEILIEMQQQFEEFVVESALRLTQGHKQKASKVLGWGRNTLTRKLKYWQEHSEPRTEEE
ncbi:response regulator [Kangiella geojedonensis]|uniref:Fis family two component transcriptional regulator n=1 Tax=Kangiella geojedonensis TaxID=914150 RepID=A0A0F6RBN2_9GAMM|nr:response regulator [Kangiella geojedonensis]AKE51291.1 Fis family two component transcriptional regulator [Kangiella geojedonensis]